MATNSKNTGTHKATGFGSDPEGKPGAEAAKSKSKAKPKADSKRNAKKEKKRPKVVRKSANKPESVIPKAVSNRMLRRALVITGIPTVISFTILPFSLFARNQGWFEVPTSAVFGGSLGFLAIGFLGISYSLLSASWDEDVSGSILGIKELKLNWRRFREARRANRES